MFFYIEVIVVLFMIEIVGVVCDVLFFVVGVVFVVLG